MESGLSLNSSTVAKVSMIIIITMLIIWGDCAIIFILVFIIIIFTMLIIWGYWAIIFILVLVFVIIIFTVLIIWGDWAIIFILVLVFAIIILMIVDYDAAEVECDTVDDYHHLQHHTFILMIRI